MVAEPHLEASLISEEEDLKLMDGAFFAQGYPYDLFRKMRDEDPLHWTKGKFGRDYWSVTRHADVQKILGDTERFSSQRWGVSLPTSAEMVDPSKSEHARLQQAGAMLPTLDPPRHTVARGKFTARFSPRAINQLEDKVRQVASEILDSVDPSKQIDFVLDVAARLPTSMIFTIMDIPREDWPMLFHYTNMHTCPEEPEFSIGTPLETRQKGVQGSINYCRELGLRRRGGSGADLITQIAQIEIDGKLLSDDELGFLGHMFIVGGQETTRNSLSAGMLELARNPAEYQRLRNDRSLLKTLPDEFIRWATPVAHLMRTAKCDVEMHGKTIREGDWVVSWMASANRDERAFQEPDMFDVGRRQNPHVSFGYGPHFCLGAWLGRLQIRTIMGLILDRFETLELRGEPESVASIQFCGMKHLPFALHEQA